MVFGNLWDSLVRLVLAPFVRRELVRLVRKGWATNDRLWLVILVITVIVGTAVVWDWYDWERHSIPTQRQFAHAALGLVGLTLVALTASMVFAKAAATIAAERDQKALDALLTTELTAGEIVAGTMAEGLVRAGNGLSATLPVILVVFLAGVDPWLIVLGLAGLASTALVVAAFSVVASVEAATRNRAVAAATGMILGWLGGPFTAIALVPLFRVRPPSWLMQAAFWLFDSSPLGVVCGISGIMPRPGSIAERLSWMIALQTAGALALALWATWRLRPASRSLYDAQGRSVWRRMLRLSQRRLDPRPACGDDPICWVEVNAGRGRSRVSRLPHQCLEAFGLGLIAIGTWWFAGPAFAELAERGYRPSREAFTMPELNPLVRVLINRMVVPLAGTKRITSLGEVAPGQARLEFNSALRMFSATIVCCYIANLIASGSQSVTGERSRDTWLGVLATPLSGRDVVRGKMRGVLSKNRGTFWLAIVLWTVALLSGAVHPLGCAAACLGLIVFGEFYAACGVAQGLWAGVERAPDTPLVFLVRVVVAVGGSTLLIFTPCFLAWTWLYTYEDVYSASHGMAFPEFRGRQLSVFGARTVVTGSIGLLVAIAAGTWWFTRTLYRDFDRLVGRPSRPPAQVAAASSGSFTGREAFENPVAAAPPG